jgi:hypothetical protein
MGSDPSDEASRVAVGVERKITLIAENHYCYVQPASGYGDNRRMHVAEKLLKWL